MSSANFLRISRSSWAHSACTTWTILCSGLCASVSSTSMDSPPWTRHWIISCSSSGLSSDSSPEATLTKMVFTPRDGRIKSSKRSKSDSSVRFSKTASAGMRNLLLLFSCSSPSSSPVSSEHRSSAVQEEKQLSAGAPGDAQLRQCAACRAVQLEWWTFVFARPRGYPPLCSCIAPPVLRPFSVGFEWWEPVADSSDRLFPARPEGTAIPSIWLETRVSLPTDSCPSSSGHAAQLPVFLLCPTSNLDSCLSSEKRVSHEIGVILQTILTFNL